MIRKLAAETLGSAFLLAVVVGSGIMAERLSAGNVALALLANAIATGCGLTALILAFAPVSGAHFNPVVTLGEAIEGRMRAGLAAAYIAAQCAGAFAGVAAAHCMFALPAFALSPHPRTGLAQWFSEFVATAGLLLVIRGVNRGQPQATAVAVGLYIASAYWFTASTSFANPAVTIARAFTPTFAGIRIQDAPAFIAAQTAAAFAASFLGRWLFAPASATASAS